MTTDLLVKILAVIGSGAGGGLGLGLLAQLLLRTMTTRKPPRWYVQTVRLLGGAICAWLVALWLFGGGGSGIGGTGGLGFGSGEGKGEGKKTGETGKTNGGAVATSSEESLRIVVLGRVNLSESDIKAERWYGIDTAEGLRMQTFVEVQETIRKRQQERPPLRRIELVLYNDSPDEHLPIVTQLRTWAADRNGGKMKVDLLRRDREAPRK